MKRIFHLLRAAFGVRLSLANEEPEPLANDAVPTSLANEDGIGALDPSTPGKVFIKYGLYPHGQKTQMFDEDSAKTMAQVQAGGLVNWVKGVLRAGWHRVSGQDLPFYKGHPDVAGSKDTDKTAFGWVKGIIPMANGAEFDVEWTPEGEKLVTSKAYRFFSPHWDVLDVKGKANTVRPVIFKSFGLTNNPNMAVQALANEDPAVEASDAVKDPPAEEAQEVSDLAKLAKACGLADDATLADVLGCVGDLVTKVNGYEQIQADAVKAAVDQVEVDKEALKAQVGMANEAAEAAKAETVTAKADAGRLQSLCNEHAEALATTLIDGLVKVGKLIPAERAAKITELSSLANAAEMTAAHEVLTKLPVKLKTTQTATAGVAEDAKTMSLANENPEAQRRQEMRDLVESHKKRLDPEGKNPSKAHELAWRAVRAERPDLFEKTE